MSDDHIFTSSCSEASASPITVKDITDFVKNNPDYKEPNGYIHIVPERLVKEVSEYLGVNNE